jgi:hypothetical protein
MIECLTRGFVSVVVVIVLVSSLPFLVEIERLGFGLVPLRETAGRERECEVEGAEELVTVKVKEGVGGVCCWTNKEGRKEAMEEEGRSEETELEEERLGKFLGWPFELTKV